MAIALTVTLKAQTFYGSTDLKVFRDGRDKEFRNRVESPLKEDDFARFDGLNYFPVDSKFRVTAAFTRTSSEAYFQMPTSSGKAKKFVKYGILKFKIGGKPYHLSIRAIRNRWPGFRNTEICCSFRFAI